MCLILWGLCWGNCMCVCVLIHSQFLNCSLVIVSIDYMFVYHYIFRFIKSSLLKPFSFIFYVRCRFMRKDVKYHTMVIQKSVSSGFDITFCIIHFEATLLSILLRFVAWRLDELHILSMRDLALLSFDNIFL